MKVRDPDAKPKVERWPKGSCAWCHSKARVSSLRKCGCGAVACPFCADQLGWRRPEEGSWSCGACQQPESSDGPELPDAHAGSPLQRPDLPVARAG